MSDQKQRKEPDVFDDPKLRLYTKVPVKEGAKLTSFRFKMYENNPVLSVDYGWSNDKGYRQTHDTNIDPAVYNQILIAIQRAVAGKPGYLVQFENWGHPFVWDQEQKKNVPSKEKLNVSNLYVGKREDGVVFIQYAAAKREAVDFEFTDNKEWHRVTVNGNSGDAGSSALAALAWVELMQDVYNTIYATKWKEPEYRRRFRMEMAQKHGKGGGGNRTGGSGGYTQSQTTNRPAPTETPEVPFDGDDDIPF